MATYCDFCGFDTNPDDVLTHCGDYWLCETCLEEIKVELDYQEGLADYDLDAVASESEDE